MPFYRVPVSETLLEHLLSRFPVIFFFVSKFLVSKSSFIDRTNTSSCHGTSQASWSGSHGFQAAGAVTTGREKPRAWELEDQEERDRYGDGPRPKRTGRTLARTSGSPPGAQAGQCDGRRSLRKMVRLMIARKSRSCARALSVPAGIGGVALHRSRLVGGAVCMWCGVHGQAEQVLVPAERSSASVATRCGCACIIPGTGNSPDLGPPRPQRSGGSAKFLSVRTAHIVC